MKITSNTSDIAILEELGKRLKRVRIDMHLSQQELSRIAGVSFVTISRIEEGNPCNTLTLIRILRVLGDLDKLDLLLPQADFRPTDILRYNKKVPQRVSRKSQKEAEARIWKWGDEE